MSFIIQTNAEYSHEEGTILGDNNVQGTFTTYYKVRLFARGVLLSDEDEITKQSYIKYEEAAPDEKDSGNGENAILHAISDYGINYLVSVTKDKELENERLTEGAMQIL
ncbi:hypothetical protein ASPWEDRAFT_28545 [Aspergillus wentii DTO 134E9]|uniref:Uncharacterized protein n=1 Tax=Aspergillus wentii DTO 134E9 TaxID=1073089 RepID=A0A1L9RM00_ASPWE|nr:uncharacterized protein ASPWEDRAFT_28545 [Aspergillus wentii DTO 134E9]OJJ35951.1 hypothetical protein ASPWEDRAFT_28545 [Aspergillus wentii DTO 134E9]